MQHLAIGDHPLVWRRSVAPCHLADASLRRIPDGALAGGTRTDSVIVVDSAEAARRSAAGLGAVTSLTLLDVLLGIPLECPIADGDLTDHEVRVLREAPAGCVQFNAGSVIRKLRVPATAVAAVVRAPRWRAAMRRTAAFAPFAQRVVVVTNEPKPAEVIEAQLAGVGIWVENAQGQLTEHLAPEVFTSLYFKAAGWRFAENAYDAAVAAGPSVLACSCC